ncbi:MAG: class I SAM-dependent methyltransferase [Candidatus Omnitrophica bacterium]|nr:class I SAM-dependent methyltransferase [Candidatus Omnitrophota bacterium]
MTKIYTLLHRFLTKPQQRGQYSSGLWQELVRNKALLLIPESSKKILEVGCGEGLFLSQILKKIPNSEIYGIDNSRQRIYQAQQYLKDISQIHLSVEDALALSFRDCFFDCCVCVNVFFNMPDIITVKKAILEINRVLRSKGYFIFDIRNAKNPLLALKYRLAPLYDQSVKNLPLKTYHFREIEDIIKSIGFCNIEKYPISGIKEFAPIFVIKAQKV